MTICVSVKTRDGVVLGTDSMSTVMMGQATVAKTYSNARKLCQIRDLPIGVFFYGLGNFGSRTVFSIILEYSRNNQETSVEGIARSLTEHVRLFYEGAFRQMESKPDFGLFVAGYSKGSDIVEEWEIKFPVVMEPQGVRRRDTFGATWRAIEGPFTRLNHGYDPQLLDFLESHGVSNTLLQEFVRTNPFQARVLFDSMPLQDAVNFAVYVLRTTIDFTAFEIGPPRCGGPLQIAVVSEEEGFYWVSKPEIRAQEVSDAKQ